MMMTMVMMTMTMTMMRIHADDAADGGNDVTMTAPSITPAVPALTAVMVRAGFRHLGARPRFQHLHRSASATAGGVAGAAVGPEAREPIWLLCLDQSRGSGSAVAALCALLICVRLL